MAKQRKILVADDDRITREIIGGILTKAGHEVVFAEDGQSALEMASSESPDLVFIDGLMPKLHGFLACKAIKELDSPPKVIVLTGVYTKISYQSEARKSFNADDLLKKPCSPDELLACLEKHLPDDSIPELMQPEDGVHLPDDAIPEFIQPEDGDQMNHLPDDTIPEFMQTEGGDPMKNQADATIPEFMQPEDGDPTKNLEDDMIPEFLQAEGGDPMRRMPDDTIPVFMQPEDEDPMKGLPDEMIHEFMQPEDGDPMRRLPDGRIPIFIQPEDGDPMRLC